MSVMRGSAQRPIEVYLWRHFLFIFISTVLRVSSYNYFKNFRHKGMSFLFNEESGENLHNHASQNIVEDESQGMFYK